MCATCGCSGGAAEHAHDHDHDHDHDHHHEPHHHEPEARLVKLEADLLARNRELAARNRGWLLGRGVLAVNLLSSPGAGKTTLLEKTLAALGGTPPVLVIEGDQATDLDAERIRRAGARAVQINTGTGCHLDAAMVGRGLAELAPAAGAIVMIENVGNLVCPALFDLGEAARVVVASTPEGEDKALKYPHMFQRADLILLNKCDLLPHLDFDPARFAAHAQTVRPGVPILQVSARTGAGLEAWLAWLRARLDEVETRTL